MKNRQVFITDWIYILNYPDPSFRSSQLVKLSNDLILSIPNGSRGISGINLNYLVSSKNNLLSIFSIRKYEDTRQETKGKISKKAN